MGAADTLPYLAGSGPVVAQSYGDAALAHSTYKPWQAIAALVVIWVLGTIGELFVPTLPLNIPRREFGVYSWLALFKSQACGLSCVPRTRANRSLIIQELEFEATDELDKLMSLDELQNKFSDKRVKFVVERLGLEVPDSSC